MMKWYELIRNIMEEEEPSGVEWCSTTYSQGIQSVLALDSSLMEPSSTPSILPTYLYKWRAFTRIRC